MSKQDKQKQTEKFVGCILSVKTKPGKYGEGIQHIIGTVREIDVDSAEQAIVLDQAMSNGQMLPDGYVLLSSQIADLQVMGKANEIEANLKSAYSHSEARKSQEPRVYNDSSDINSGRYGLSQVGTNTTGFPSDGESLQTVNGNYAHNSSVLQPTVNHNNSTALINSIASSLVDMTLRDHGVQLDNNEPGGHTIAKPKPRKLGDGAAYASSPQHGLSHVIGGNHHQSSLMSTNTTSTISTNPVETKSSTNLGLSTHNSTSTGGGDAGNILLRTFGNLTNSGGSSINGQALINAMTSSNKSAVPATNLKQNSAPSPSKLTPQKPIAYDHKKLGVLSQFVNNAPSSEPNHSVNNLEDVQVQALAPGTPSGKSGNNTHTPRNQAKGSGRQRHGETFESMSKDEMAVEFDFESNNAQFEKLPVSSAKPTKVTKNPPHFTNTDTTYLADRVVESIKLRGAATTRKQFVTDTGVAIPSVDLPTRSKILNLAHEVGLTHSRVVEVMGRAVAQAVIPLLGDSYRLSPERIEDRPWVLVCSGPHWQGAIGIAAARILASLGVHTCVHAPKEELQLCAAEEVLYKFSGEMFSRHVNDFRGIHFDLVIMAVDDHLSRTLTLAPYSKWLRNCSVVFVDPPLISSYRQQLEMVCAGTDKGRKIVIVSPALPIAYPADTSVKLFLVNLGIPNDIFEKNDVIYRSPFGDKLVVQIFSSSSK